MSEKEYNEGYRHGAASTQAQARGARDAAHDRQKHEKEERERWDALRRQQEELQRQDQRQRELERERDHRRQAEFQEAERQKQAAKSSAAQTKSQDHSGTRNFFAFIGMILGAIGGYQTFQDNWIAVGICAALAAWLAAALYKVIISLVLVVVVMWLFIAFG